MNEKIKELAEQAGFYIPYPPYLDGDDDRVLRIEKFAEMIIRECCRKMEDTGVFYGNWMSKVIKEHFGIDYERED